MSYKESTNFSGEDWRRTRFSAIPEAPPASSSSSSSHSIFGGTTEKLENNDILMNSSKEAGLSDEKINNQLLNEEKTKPSPPERKSSKYAEKLLETKEISTSSTEKVSKKVNPRIIHLDFIEKNVSHVQEVRQVIINSTQIRNFCIKVLPKGGISILLGNQKAKSLVEGLLNEKLEGKLCKKGFLVNKKLFELSCRVPKDLDPKTVMETIKADKFIKRGGSECIFFLPSQNAANELITNGKFVSPYHLEFAPFIFAPRIACQNCGSSEHSECSKIICKTCASDHKTEDCKSNVSKCYYCKGDHAFKNCLLFKEKFAFAKATKKKTYAQALSTPVSQKTVVAKHQIMERNIREIDSYTSEIVSTYCKVAGVPFKENLMDEVQKELQVKSQKTAAPQEPRSLSPDQQPKKKSSKSSKKEYATAVINSYERSNNPASSVTKESSASDMTGVEGNMEAFCTCGVQFKPNPGWKNHFVMNKKCIDPKVTCACGKFILTPDNWKTTYGPLCQHLKKECRGSSK